MIPMEHLLKNCCDLCARARTLITQENTFLRNSQDIPDEVFLHKEVLLNELHSTLAEIKSLRIRNPEIGLQKKALLTQIENEMMSLLTLEKENENLIWKNGFNETETLKTAKVSAKKVRDLYQN